MQMSVVLLLQLHVVLSLLIIILNVANSPSAPDVTCVDRLKLPSSIHVHVDFRT